jgi:hypothetical protein
MGGGRSSNPEARKSQLDRNIDSLPTEFKPNSEGFIGLPGKSGDDDKRQLLVTNPVSTYASLAKHLTDGARIDPDAQVKYGGSSWVHEGGDRITIRPSSKSGSPVIEIVSTHRGLASQKIHIEEIN